MVFSYPVINQIQALYKAADKIFKVSELRKCARELYEILDYPPPQQQVSDLLDELELSGLQRIKTLEDAILNDYKILEQMMRTYPGSPEVTFLLDISGTEDHIKGFPETRRAALLVAWQYLLKSELEKPYGLECLWRDDFVKKAATEEVRTANVIEWEKEKAAIDDISQLRKDIAYVKTHYHVTDKVDTRRLKTAVQNVCNFLIKSFIVENSLGTLKINKIPYSYRPPKGSKEAVIVLHITQGNPISFEGIPAENLYLLLAYPWEYVEAEKFKFPQKTAVKNLGKRNEYLRKDFDDKNAQIGKKYHRYGFIYGACDLINSDGYSHRINPNLAHLIHRVD